MPRSLRAWIAFAALAGGLPSLGGCGRSEPSAIDGRVAQESAAPERLALPATLVPLAREGGQATGEPARSIQAQFAQAERQFASSGGRIVELNPQTPGESTALIRQPAAVAKTPVAEVASRPRSSYVPTFADHQSPSEPAVRSQWTPSPRVEHTSVAPPAAANPQPTIQPQPAFQPQPQRAPNRSAMQPVSERATAISQRAFEKAQRGLYYSARADLVQALQLIAQAKDIQSGTAAHSESLTAGLSALREARDFAPQPGRDAAGIRAAEIARAHRTPVLKQAAGELSPVFAQQQYYNYAQQLLTAAVAGEPAASQALFALGKIQSTLASTSADPQALHGPQAMVFHQVALAVDSRNYLAANELGVLLAQYGQLPEARQLLVHSVTLKPHQEGWHNLAIVHRRLGENELARLADGERELLAKTQAASQTVAAANLIRWVDPHTFAASAGPDAQGPQSAARPTATPSRR